MKIYTKTGDKGQTGIIGGKRLMKSDLRLESYGTVDELNSHLGLLRDQKVIQSKKEQLVTIQQNLFVIGARLASVANQTKFKLPDLNSLEILKLENWIDEMESELAPMTHFILPGGHESVSFGHISRCVCRRAERAVVRLSEVEIVEEMVISYLNRLSDYLFVLCRWMGKELKVEEIPWKP